MKIAETVALKSKDPSSKMGCVIVDPKKRVVSLGYNGMLQGADESEDAKVFSTHLTQVLKKQAQIDLETIRIRGANETYGAPADLRQMYNDLKAYVGRENADTKLL